MANKLALTWGGKENEIKIEPCILVDWEGHELKNWKYLYIPSQQVQTNSSFNNLVQRFEVVE